MKKKRFWEDESYQSSKPLRGNISTQHLIVGGGVAGLFVAYYLLEAGEKHITLIERDSVGMGSTGHSAGMLVGEPETAPWGVIVNEIGNERAVLFEKAQAFAMKDVADFIKKERIDCEFALDNFYLLIKNSWSTRNEGFERKLRRELGMNSTFLQGKSFSEELNAKGFVEGEKLERGISVNPLSFSHGMANYLRERGVLVYEHTPLKKVLGKRALTPRGSVTFGNIIYARGTAEKHPELVNYLTTIAVTRRLSHKELEELKMNDKDMFVDEESRGSFHYGKITGENRLLVGYGDVLTKNTVSKSSLHKPHYKEIKHFIRKTFGPINIEYAWSAAYSLHKKAVPLVCVSHESATIGGAGTQIASIACASYVASAVLGKKHPLDDLFSGSNACT